MTLADDLVRAAAEAIRRRNVRPWKHSETEQYRLEGADVVVAVLKRLSEECQTGTLWRFVDAAGFAHLAHQIEEADRG